MESWDSEWVRRPGVRVLSSWFEVLVNLGVGDASFKYASSLVGRESLSQGRNMCWQALAIRRPWYGSGEIGLLKVDSKGSR